MTIYSDFLEILKENNKELEDIVFIGSSDGVYSMAPNHFRILTNDVFFQHNLNLPEDFRVVFSNGDQIIIIILGEYDMQSFVFVNVCKKTENTKLINKILADNFWTTMRELNE